MYEEYCISFSNIITKRKQSQGRLQKNINKKYSFKIQKKKTAKSIHLSLSEFKIMNFT